jgi:hypothetical protein
MNNVSCKHGRGTAKRTLMAKVLHNERVLSYWGSYARRKSHAIGKGCCIRRLMLHYIYKFTNIKMYLSPKYVSLSFIDDVSMGNTKSVWLIIQIDTSSKFDRVCLFVDYRLNRALFYQSFPKFEPTVFRLRFGEIIVVTFPEDFNAERNNMFRYQSLLVTAKY